MRSTAVGCVLVTWLIVAGCGAGDPRGAASSQGMGGTGEASSDRPSWALLTSPEPPPEDCGATAPPRVQESTGGANPRYTITDLGVTIEKDLGLWLNNAGQVAGSRWVDPDSSPAFYWKAGTGMVDLPLDTVAGINESGQVGGTRDGQPVLWHPDTGVQQIGAPPPEGTYAQSSAVNDRGQVAGAIEGDETHDWLSQAYWWDPSGAMARFDLPDSRAVDLNNTGQMAVIAAIPVPEDSENHAFLWTPGSAPIDIGKVAGDVMLNERGQITASMSGPVSEVGMNDCAFLWNPDTATRTYLGGGSPSALNDHGQVTGMWWALDTGYPVVFLWDRDTGMTDLGTLPGMETVWDPDINERGQVAANTGNPDRRSRAILWDPEAGIVDLGILHKGDSSGAFAINDRGQVVGWSGEVDWTSDLPSRVHAVLWTPQ